MINDGCDRADKNQDDPNHERTGKSCLCFRPRLKTGSRTSRRVIAGFGAGQDQLGIARGGHLRGKNFLKAGRASHLGTSLRLVALDVLAADRTGKFEIAHARGNIPHLRATRNAAFKTF